MTEKPHLDEEALAELQDVMEDEFEVLIQTYLTDSRDRIASLKEALAAGDADAVARTAHSFKGSCINIGAPRLGDLCQAAEQAGKVADLARAQALMADIEAEFSVVTGLLEGLSVR
ncbi:Hpt domain-containing protein [uncultured Marinobacter sp.]|uniref:Hpt domain-containing protein n=1 Tax=uncultured Marinobacter sp. TaxID=187379 RepID=UPI000C0B536B|nr:histidine kinase [Marinobacter sp.]MBI44528.1 histidine kinase [Oceanospirillales bacterium]|tara:strand:+ start:861 stop:1208 length:348 start_codon:yes stop_codon:yes gene_type:complete